MLRRSTTGAARPLIFWRRRRSLVTRLSCHPPLCPGPSVAAPSPVPSAPECNASTAPAAFEDTDRRFWKCPIADRAHRSAAVLAAGLEIPLHRGCVRTARAALANTSGLPNAPVMRSVAVADFDPFFECRNRVNPISVACAPGHEVDDWICRRNTPRRSEAEPR
jgi:hypothetical protein